jgi:uncharacterized repeat protein (TIGR01451 family)
MKRIYIALLIALCLLLSTFWASNTPPRASAQAPTTNAFGTSSALPITLLSPIAQGPPPTVVTLSNGYRITFLGVTYNADGTSTWRYTVEELPSAQDLSNWVLELPDCVRVVTAWPEPWEVVHPDPNAHLDGIKWGASGLPGIGEFTLTLNGHWAVGVTTVAAKGPDLAYGLIAGPICEEAVQLEGQKMADPAVAQPGDVLTYTLSFQNASTSWAYAVDLNDPIPAGTTYVGGSAQATSGHLQYRDDDDQICWQGDLAPGQTVTVTFMVWVHDDVISGTLIANAAYVGPEVFTATTRIEAADEPAWTLLVYLSADNNLDNPAYRIIRDKEAFNALERAAYLNPRLRIYVQWDRSPDHTDDVPDDHTRRYRVRPDLNPFRLAAYTEYVDTWDLGEENMGDPQTLHEFITWARGLYNSAYDALSIIGHGGGWTPTLEPALGYTRYLPAGIAWDDSSGDYLSTKELGDALYWATDKQAAPFDVLFFDASMMAMLENAYQVRESATYLVASEGAAWARFAYDRYLDRVDDTTSPRDLAVQVVREYAASLKGYPLTMGAMAIDLASIGPVADAVDHLAIVLSETLTTTRPYIAQAYTLTQKFDSNWDLALQAPDAYIDLRDFACQLYQLVPLTESEVLSATQAVTDSLGPIGSGMIVTETHRNGHPWLNPAVTWTFTGAHGVSIYLPLGEDMWLRDYYRAAELDLAAHTHWDEFIHDGWYAGQMSPELPFTATMELQETEAPEPIDPAMRPGLLSLRRFWSFLPLAIKGTQSNLAWPTSTQ